MTTPSKQDKVPGVAALCGVFAKKTAAKAPARERNTALLHLFTMLASVAEALGPTQAVLAAVVMVLLGVVLLKASGMLERRAGDTPFTPATAAENAMLKKS